MKTMPKLRPRPPKNTATEEPKIYTNQSPFDSFLQRVNTLSTGFESFVEDIGQQLDTKFDTLIETITENNALTDELKDRIADIDESVSAAKIQKNELKTECQALKDTLKVAKKKKSRTEKELSKVEKKVSKLDQRLDQLKDEDKELSERQKESKLLAQVMDLRYKKSSSGRIMTFEVNGRKRTEKLISTSSEDIAGDFWSLINKRYNL